MAGDCVNDVDCPGTKVCRLTTEVYSCVCLSQYGWTGPNCDEFLPTAYTSFVLIGICVLVLFVSFSVCCYDLHLIRSKLTCTVSLTNNVLMVLYSLFASLTLGISEITRLVKIASPHNVALGNIQGYYAWKRLQVYGIPQDIQVKQPTLNFYVIHTYMLPGIAFLFSSYAALQVGVLWAQLATASQRLDQMDRSLKFFKWTIFTFEAVMLIVYVLLLGLENSVPWFSITYGVILALVITVLVVGRLRIVRVLKLAANVQEPYASPSTPKSSVASFSLFVWRFSPEMRQEYRVIKAINRCCNLLVVMLGVQLVLCSVRAYISHGSRIQADPLFLVNFSHLFIAFSVLICVDFTHTNVVKQTRVSEEEIPDIKYNSTRLSESELVQYNATPRVETGPVRQTGTDMV
mmetsp:Transcript_16157/g.27821  ORF Transcript_16157/g.27821 Transcript_16157/m.27821 type:complete len:404 (+) Transcript_16157:130-1341(+)